MLYSKFHTEIKPSGYPRRYVTYYNKSKLYINYLKSRLTFKQKFISKVMEDIHTEILKRMVEDNFIYTMPGIGVFQMFKKKALIVLNEDGTINFDKTPVDWRNTLKHKNETGELKLIPQDFEHTHGYVFSIKWKRFVNKPFNNISFYTFRMIESVKDNWIKAIHNMDEVPKCKEVKFKEDGN